MLDFYELSSYIHRVACLIQGRYNRRVSDIEKAILYLNDEINEHTFCHMRHYTFIMYHHIEIHEYTDNVAEKFPKCIESKMGSTKFTPHIAESNTPIQS